jgi:hypothetical protein
MKKTPTVIVTTIALFGASFFTLGPSAMAQGGGREGGREGGNRQGRPGMEGGRGMRDRNSAKFQLNRLWHGIGELEDGQNKLSKLQAKKIVDAVRPWTTKPKMTEVEAKKLDLQLRNVLTVAQKNEVAKAGPGGRGGFGGPGMGGPGGGRGDSRRGPGGRDGEGRGPRGEGRRGGEGPRDGGPRDGGPRDGGPRGGGRPGGGGRDFDPKQMQAMRTFRETMNPFYAPTGYKEWKTMPDRMQEGMTRRYKTARETLEALSRKSR